MRIHTRCKLGGCTGAGHIIKDVEYFSKGYCQKHYLRLLRWGDTSIVHSVRGEDRLKNPLYKTWVKMRERCNSPASNGYKYYGARGITICSRWDDFNKILIDMGERPKGTSLDRIDNDGNYGPHNCRWATKAQQMSNRRLPHTNKSGVAGVYWSKARGTWGVEFYRDKRCIRIGHYKTKAEALEAYTNALDTHPLLTN